MQFLRFLLLFCPRSGARQKQDFVRLASALDAMSPLRVLSRGYSLAENAEGQTVRSAAQIQVGERLHLRFAEGGADCTVDSIQEGE